MQRTPSLLLSIHPISFSLFFLYTHIRIAFLSTYTPYRFLVACIEQSSAYWTYRLHSTDSSANMMAKMIDFSSTKSPALRAVDVIHGFVPLVAGLFYLVSAAILAFRRDRQEEIRRRPSRAVVLWPVLAVLVAYVSWFGMLQLDWVLETDMLVLYRYSRPPCFST